jgi:RNA polymerase sigma-70 factor (ECF subfamily)
VRRVSDFGEASDEDLLAAIADGDRQPIGLLYDRHVQSVFGLALCVTRDRAAAADVVQDVFLRAWLRAATFRAERGDVRGWLLGIARNRATDVCRTRRHETIAPEPVLARLADPRTDVSAAACRNVEGDEVRAAMRLLPAFQREALELTLLRGLTHREVATRTGLPLGTVKGRVRLGLSRLRALLDAPRPALSA